MEYSATRLQNYARRTLTYRPPFKRHQPVRYALLQAHGKVQCPSIRSISSTGIRLDGAFGLQPGDAVSVRLPSQQTVSGSVDWAVAGFCGIVFSHALATDDPCLAEA